MKPLLINIRRLIIIFLILFTVIIALQYSIFHYLFYRQLTYDNVEAIIVFNGSIRRIRQGFRLLNSGLADTCVISPATVEKLAIYRQKYDKMSNVKFILEPNARTTYENAYYVAQIIKKHRIRSVILVTSDFHMPRAFLLLKSMLLGKNVTIYRNALPSVRKKTNKWKNSLQVEKVLYNEMVQFWGNIYELSFHKITGRMASRKIRKSKFVKKLEKILLCN